MYEYWEAALHPNVNLQINRNTSMCTEKYFSQRKEEELSQNLLCSAGHQKELDLVLMHGYFSPCETFADREFLSETNKQYAELSVNQTLPKRSPPNDYNNNGEGKCVYMDACHTEVQANRPTDDVEAIYDDVTGEIRVKLWEHEYPIDPKCSLTPEVCFRDEKAGCIFEVCDTDEDMLTENDETHDPSLYNENCKRGKQTRRDIELVDGSHTPVIPEHEAETTAKNRVSLDSTFETGKQRTRSYTCMNNKPFIGIDMSSSSLPVIQKHKLNRTSCSMASEHFILSEKYADLNSSMSEHQLAITTGRCQNENLNSHSEEQCLQCHSLSYSGEAHSDQRNTLQNTIENNNETVAFGIAADARTRTILHPNRQYQTWIQQGGMAVNNEYNKSKFEHASNQNVQNSQNTAVSQITHSKDLGTKLSPGYFCPKGHQGGRAKVYNENGKLKRGCRLWEYIRNLLLDPCTNPALIRWEDRDEGTFKLVQNKTIAYNWGMKKGNTDMSYEKLSRAMRYYYKKMIFQPVLGKRLVYKFGPRATGWKHIS